MKEYKIVTQENITKELLNKIKVGDLIKINNWKRPLRVIAVSENFFIMAMKAFGSCVYSICEKRKWKYGYYCAPDNCYCKYDYANKTECEEALKELEAGELELSRRRCLQIKTISIKEE